MARSDDQPPIYKTRIKKEQQEAKKGDIQKKGDDGEEYESLGYVHKDTKADDAEDPKEIDKEGPGILIGRGKDPGGSGGNRKEYWRKLRPTS